MVTQIWSATDIIFCHFRPFFALLPHYSPWKLKFGKNVIKHLEILSFYTSVPLINIIWCMVRKVQSATQNYFVILDNILPFYLPNSRKHENIKNKKKISRHIMILHTCTKNHDHLLYCSRDLERDGCNCYFHFGLYFSLLPL